LDNTHSMSATKNQAKPAHRGLSLQIPIFYKLMVSMLFVSMIPMMLLGIVSMGGTDSIVDEPRPDKQHLCPHVRYPLCRGHVEFLPCQQHHEPDCKTI